MYRQRGSLRSGAYIVVCSFSFQYNGCWLQDTYGCATIVGDLSQFASNNNQPSRTLVSYQLSFPAPQANPTAC
jgi:hypothetical protein